MTFQIEHANPVGAFLAGRQARQQYDAGQQQMGFQRQQNDRANRAEQRGIEASQQQRQQWLAENLPQALAYSDTPEKWDQSVAYLESLGFNEAAQFRGRFDMRDALLAQVTGQQRTQQQPASVMEYEFFSRLPEDQQQVFMNLQRSGNLLEIGGVPHYRNASGQVVPLSSLLGEMQGQSAIAGAVEGEKVRSRAEAERGALDVPGRQALDSSFAPEATAWASGGYEDTLGQLQLLEGVRDQLRSGQNLTGPVLGNTPRVIRNFTNPGSVAAQDSVEQVVQRNLRVILGAQFTENEGQRLIARAYNPALDEAENLRRLDLLIEQIREAAEAKNEAVTYFLQNGTLSGFQGGAILQPGGFLAEFERRIEGGGNNQPRRESQPSPNDEPVPPGVDPEDWQYMTPEQRALWRN